MPEPRNPLRGEGQPREEVTGERFNNLRTRKRVRMPGPNGNIIEATTAENDSRLDEDGNYVDTETINFIPDASGFFLPPDTGTLLARSHSGLYITAPEQMATCTCWLHPARRSPTIKVGFDGRKTATGAVCSACDQRLGYIYIVVFIFCAAAILGIWKGAGLF
jgi:hypothetical protein